MAPRREKKALCRSGGPGGSAPWFPPFGERDTQNKLDPVSTNSYVPYNSNNTVLEKQIFGFTHPGLLDLWGS